jgi:hypothetical protein
MVCNVSKNCQWFAIRVNAPALLVSLSLTRDDVLGWAPTACRGVDSLVALDELGTWRPGCVGIVSGCTATQRACKVNGFPFCLKEVVVVVPGWCASVANEGIDH